MALPEFGACDKLNRAVGVRQIEFNYYRKADSIGMLMPAASLEFYKKRDVARRIEIARACPDRVHERATWAKRLHSCRWRVHSGSEASSRNCRSGGTAMPSSP